MPKQKKRKIIAWAVMDKLFNTLEPVYIRMPGSVFMSWAIYPFSCVPKKVNKFQKVVKVLITPIKTRSPKMKNK